MKKVITIAGSNSQKSINKNLLTYVSHLLKNTEVISIDLNDFVLPIYGVDYETENGIPTAVKRLDELLDAADGFIISLAEHNGSYAAVFKNTIDWLSRVNMKIWREKPMLLMATSPGDRGGATVLKSAKTYFPYLGGSIIADFSLPNFYDNFLENGISDTELKEELSQKILLFEQQLNNKFNN
ncbi:NADPH-dependent oxidoreductase [Aquimarina sp. BL5]|uniref:NADPH-dependent FMN reductase n=1 Tax=Aquimarina sp. BL5 TaxID=1714860 RepID=UPI000E4B5023|nr:NAD(P)H-dependent oxidoreductase [Aquimarina sp. BL5]AXT49923.1 NADPH-dependent oxidoreductase [Aquimarina sp. BL5]RKN01088.1 NADPH-dependent oxidoreductase [Aquimarina sp. BL5]